MFNKTDLQQLAAVGHAKTDCCGFCVNIKEFVKMFDCVFH